MKDTASRIDQIFKRAEKENRLLLLEYEVYKLLAAIDIRTPRHFFLKKGEKVDRRRLATLRSRKVVVKIVSPSIVHKTEVGGVAFVENRVAAVNKAVREMLHRVPHRYQEWIEMLPGGEKDVLSLQQVEKSIRGVLILEMVDFDQVGFGSELLLGLRHSREFGPIVSMGMGGLDVEYLKPRLKKGRAVAIASAHLLHRKDIPALLKPLAFFDKVVCDFRGRKALLSETELAETFHKWQMLAVRYSLYSKKSLYIIEEAEVNPFVIRSAKLIPLDGMCRFSRRREGPARRPYEKINYLLHPRSIAVIGVSEKMNLGHLILNNILREGFPRERVYVVKPGLEMIEGCRCYPTIAQLPETVDLFVLTLAAEQSVGAMAELLDGEKARSVVIIAGGIGEKKGTEVLEEKIKSLLQKNRREGKLTPVVNGGNCMGIYSRPGRYDTTFIPEYKLEPPAGKNPRIVYIAQSGAFMASRMSKIPAVEPLYAISLGNQVDLTASDYLRYFNDAGKDEARLFALYIEGFQPGDGLSLAKAAEDLVRQGKILVVYKGGRTEEGRQATSSHTASVAGDYDVFRSILGKAGAFVTETLLDFENSVKNLLSLDGKMVRGKRVGLVSNAGFECVILADNLNDGDELEIALLSDRTKARIACLLQPLGIDRLQDIRNPLDLTPVADDAVFAGCAEAVLEDEGVDCAVISPVPMTTALQTLPPGERHRENIYAPRSVGCRLIEIFGRSRKPLVVNIDAGELYLPLVEMLEEAGVPVFRRSDEALRFLGRYINTTLRNRQRQGRRKIAVR